MTFFQTNKKGSTKEKILDSAVRLFAQHGFDNTSMRDLAKDVGVKNPSLYNHFESKKEILTELYRFYTEQRIIAIPNIGEILNQLERMPPHEILMNLEHRFPPDVADIMTKILTIAARAVTTDYDSWKFIENNVLAPKEQLASIVKNLIELEVIEPFDIDAFCDIVMHYCFSSIALMASPLKVDNEAWKNGLSFLYLSFIKPIKKI